MNDISVRGIVLSTMPIGEYDRRVEVLTMERGKISFFARGARRQENAVGAACRPFATGVFTLIEGRNSYTLREVKIQNYFENLQKDMDAVYFGYYFLEFSAYYTREGGDERQVVELLYAALSALTRSTLPNDLVQIVFEAKLMMMNGDFDDPSGRLSDTAAYTLEFILNTPPGKLFTFVLSEEAKQELKHVVDFMKQRYIRKEFASLRILEDMKALLTPLQEEKDQVK